MLKSFPIVPRTVAGVLCGAAIAMSPGVADAAPELGVYRWDAPQGPANVDAFGTWLGRPATVAASFEAKVTWDDIDGADWQLGPWSSWVRAKSGRNISLGVPMLPQSGASLASCASGQYDSRWRTLANELSAYGLHWAYLRLGWEMDGTWYSWTAASGSGKEASYAGCFRRMVQTMRQAQPANQWKFVLNPTIGWNSKSYLDAIWPGDAYVDVVAIDFYDQSWASNTYPYPSNCDATCRQTRQQNAWNDYSKKLFMLRDFAIAHGKTVALPEWGVAVRPDGHGGGDNPFFIRKMHEFINDPANKVAYHVYWDVKASDLDAQLSSSTRFPQSAALFKQLFGSAPAPVNAAPTVSFTAPASGQTVSGTVSYGANASDDGGVTRVEFSVDGTALVTDLSSPFGGSLDTTKLVNGTHTLRAVAFDAAGLSTSVTRSITVQNGTSTPPPPGGPVVDFSAPIANATLTSAFSNSSACEVKGTGISRVVFFMDAVQLNTETGAPWNCSVDPRQYSNGTHTLKAVAYNSAGASTSVIRTVNIQNGSTGPTNVAFLAPSSGGVLSGSFSNSRVCELTGTGMSRVVFFLGNTQLNTESGAPWNCSIDTRRFSNGTHTLKAVAYNSAGASTTVTRSVTIRN